MEKEKSPAVFIGAIDNLPTLPGIAIRILAAVQKKAFGYPEGDWYQRGMKYHLDLGRHNPRGIEAWVDDWKRWAVNDRTRNIAMGKGRNIPDAQKAVEAVLRRMHVSF